MSSDMYDSSSARQLLSGKTIFMFGDSNMRALYKDLLWLLEDGRITPMSKMRNKNEISHANDCRLSNGATHSGRQYQEVRLYEDNCFIKFHFITRLHSTDFIDTIRDLKRDPDVLVINSCVWDLTRWGSNGVQQFKENIKLTFEFLKSRLPSTRIIWLTTLPPSFNSHGAFLTKEIEFMRNMLPWHIVFANKYASDVATSYYIDVLDLHYNFRFLLDSHTSDGIHWDSTAMRYATNLFLTHIALCWKCPRPCRYSLHRRIVERSQYFINDEESQWVANNTRKPLSDLCPNGGNGMVIKKNKSQKPRKRYRPYAQSPCNNANEQYNFMSANYSSRYRFL